MKTLGECRNTIEIAARDSEWQPFLEKAEIRAIFDGLLNSRSRRWIQRGGG